MAINEFRQSADAQVTETVLAPVRWELRRVNEHTVDWFAVPLDQEDERPES